MASKGAMELVVVVVVSVVVVVVAPLPAATRRPPVADVRPLGLGSLLPGG